MSGGGGRGVVMGFFSFVLIMHCIRTQWGMAARLRIGICLVFGVLGWGAGVCAVSVWVGSRSIVSSARLEEVNRSSYYSSKRCRAFTAAQVRTTAFVLPAGSGEWLVTVAGGAWAAGCG